MRMGCLALAILSVPLLGPLLGGTAAYAAHPAAAPAAPEVIAPGDLPVLEPVRSAAVPMTLAQGDFRPAPMPDADASVPVASPDDEQPQVAPALYSQKSQYRGDGFAAGSSSHARPLQPAPGLALSVPLD